MAQTRSRIYSKFILLSDTSPLIHERFISRKGLGEEITYSIIASNKGIYIDPAYNEMIRELLDEFPILGWQIYLLTCLTDDISEKKNSAAMNMTGSPWDLYYYGMPGVEHDQDLLSTKFPNTRGTFLTRALKNVLEYSS